MKTPIKLISTTAILLILLMFCSCTDEKTASLQFSKSDSILCPGTTVRLKLQAVFSDIEEGSSEAQSEIIPDRSALKAFGQSELSVELSNPAFRVLSTDKQVSKAGISAELIVLAEDDLLSGASTAITASWGGLSAESSLRVKKDPAARIGPDGVVTDPAAYDAFVNKQRRLPAGYIPPDLVRVDVPTILKAEEVNHLRRAASEALSAMFAAAEAEEGFELLARSGYRSYRTQVMLYDANVRVYGEKEASRISARPGTSEHQSGLAMDISSPVVNYQLVQEFGETAEGIWVEKNAHRFGFIIRYPRDKEHITGYSYEPWHLRWVGPELAAEIYSKDFCLEEYFSD